MLVRTVCRNGQCKEEAQKFRQCPNSEREQAVIDPKTKQEVWKPVPEEEQQVRDCMRELPAQPACTSKEQRAQPASLPCLLIALP